MRSTGLFLCSGALACGAEDPRSGNSHAISPVAVIRAGAAWATWGALLASGCGLDLERLEKMLGGMVFV